MEVVEVPKKYNDGIVRIKNWKDTLSKGVYNGKQVFIHYTSAKGIEAIQQELALSDKKRNEKREGSKPGIYVNPVTQQFNPENVEILLFLGNEKYVGCGDYVVIFSSDNSLEEVGLVTEKTWVKEYKLHGGDIKLTRENLIYMGKNPFPDVFDDK